MVVRDEIVPLGGEAGRPAPSLALDAGGTPHVGYTLRDAKKPGLKQLDTIGYATRAAGGWQLSPALATGWKVTAEIGPGGSPELWLWSDQGNRTELWRPTGGSWGVIDTVDLVRVYQVFYQGGALHSVLGDFGGNLYHATRGTGGWSKSWVKRWDTIVTPPGVLVPGAGLAIFERSHLNHIATQKVEPVPGPKPGYKMPSGPLVAPDGRLWVLQETAASWENRIMLQHRDTSGIWHTQTVRSDPTAPPPSSCPTQLGAPCTFKIAAHRSLALALVDSRPVRVELRRNWQASYSRTCLKTDPNWHGSTVKCLDPGGPAGPWASEPRKDAVDSQELLVDGTPIPLATPLVSPVIPTVATDGSRRLHIALFRTLGKQSSLRYIVVQLSK